jgi:hypothetical protein
MPANIRVRCQYLDCEYLNGLYCGNAEVEFNPKQFCLSFSAVKVAEVDDVDDEFDEEELGEEEEWLDEDDDDVDDLVSLADDD